MSYSSLISVRVTTGVVADLPSPIVEKNVILQLEAVPQPRKPEKPD
jgi:hypothetical protein